MRSFGTTNDMKEKRIVFLIKHQQEFDIAHFNWGLSPTDDKREYQFRLFKIAEAMKQAGLYSPNTYWADIRVANLIRQAQTRIRQLRRKG